MSYNIIAGPVSGVNEGVNPNSLSTGLRHIFSPENSQLETFFKLRNIKKRSYIWKMQAADNIYKGCEFSSVGSTYSSSFQTFGLSVENTDGSETTIKWSYSNGDHCLVFVKKRNEGTANPEDNFIYIASPVFGKGSQIEITGWYCVYCGDQDSVIATNPEPLSDYIVQVNSSCRRKLVADSRFLIQPFSLLVKYSKEYLACRKKSYLIL